MDDFIFKNITLIGLGLIGGSFAKTIKKANSAQNIYAIDNEETIAKAYDQKLIVNDICDVENIIGQSELVVICTPLSTYRNILDDIKPFIRPDTIISDVGSVKKCTIEMVESSLGEELLPNFIPGHPIAGTEKSGLDASFDSLFDNKKIILTPTEISNSAYVDKLSKLWQKGGSFIEILDADIHDKIYAEVSHLPQFIAYCYYKLAMKNDFLSACFKKTKSDEIYKKFFRLATSTPGIWKDIFYYNKINLLDNIVKIKELFAQVSADIESGRDDFLEGLEYSGASIGEGCDVNVDILSVLISNLIFKNCNNFEYSGSGLKDLSIYTENAPQDFYSCLSDNKSDVINSINIYVDEINQFSEIIKSGTPEDILASISF